MAYKHILERCIGTVLAMHPAKLDLITQEVFLKLMLDQNIDRTMKTPEKPILAGVPEHIYMVQVHGSLVNKNGAGASGVTSYESLKNEITSAINAGYKVIGFDFSSGGGEAYGMFELSNFIASLPAQYNVQTFGFCSAQSCSASYGLMAATQTIYATDIAEIGSIGTVMALVDISKRDEKQGEAYTILRSKDQKALYNPHEKLSAEVIADATKKLKVFDAKFDTHIASLRQNISIDTIVNLAGNTVFGNEAKQIGLIDEVVTSIDDVFAMYASSAVSNTRNNPIVDQQQGNTFMTTATTDTLVAQLAEANTNLAAARSQLEIEKSNFKLEIAKATKAEQSRVLAILDAGATFGVPEQSIRSAIEKNYSADMVADMFSNIKAGIDAANVVNTANPSQAHLQANKPAAGAAQNAGVSLLALQQLGMQQSSQNLAGGTLSMEDILSQMEAIGGELISGGK